MLLRCFGFSSQSGEGHPIVELRELVIEARACQSLDVAREKLGELYILQVHVVSHF